jgi:hypothetical protein
MSTIQVTFFIAFVYLNFAEIALLKKQFSIEVTNYKLKYVSQLSQIIT